MVFSPSASEKIEIKYQALILLFRHSDPRTNCKSIFSAGLPIFKLNIDRFPLEQFNVEYRESIKLCIFSKKMEFEYSIWKDVSPSKKGPSIYIIILLLENQTSPAFPSQMTFLTHTTILFLNTIYHLPEKSKDKKKKTCSRYIQDFKAIFGVHSAR